MTSSAAPRRVRSGDRDGHGQKSSARAGCTGGSSDGESQRAMIEVMMTARVTEPDEAGKSCEQGHRGRYHQQVGHAAPRTCRSTVATRSRAGRAWAGTRRTSNSASRLGFDRGRARDDTGGQPAAASVPPRRRSQPVSPGRLRSSSTRAGRMPPRPASLGLLGRFRPRPRGNRGAAEVARERSCAGSSSSSTRSTCTGRAVIGRMASTRIAACSSVAHSGHDPHAAAAASGGPSPRTEVARRRSPRTDDALVPAEGDHGSPPGRGGARPLERRGQPSPPDLISFMPQRCARCPRGQAGRGPTALNVV